MVNLVARWSLPVILALLIHGHVAIGARAQVLNENPDSLVAVLGDLPGIQALDDALDAEARDRPGFVGWTATTTRSTGNAPRLRTRLDLTGTNVSVRFDAEQDPSEPWLLRPADGRWGFDHAGAYAEWHPSRRWAIVFGDFRLAHGLGLVASPPRLGRAADDAFGLSRTGRIEAGSPAIRPYAGSDEDRYQSGIAVTGIWNLLSLTGFRSTRHLDAAPDSIQRENGSWHPVTRLRPAQDHATPLGSGRRRRLQLISTGGLAALSGSSFDVSALVFTEHPDLDLLPDSRLPSDRFRRRVNVSMSARVRLGRFSWSGEGGWVGPHTAGSAFLRYQDRAVSLLAGWRRFSPEYAPLWASAPSFRSGVPGNEIGYTAAAQWRPDSGGPFRLVFDRGCRIRAEAAYSRAGCLDSARIDARWRFFDWAVDAVTTWDRLREPDASGNRGPDRERFMISAVATLEPADGAAVTVSTSLRRVETTEAVGLSGNDGPPYWSSKVAARIRWEVTPHVMVQTGLADFHVAESVMGLYQAGLALTSTISTLSGDGNSIFATVTRTRSRLNWGATLRRKRSRPVRPDGPETPRTDFEIGLHVGFTWTAGARRGT